MAAPTKSDWGHIHAKAWQEPEFRKLLETDPKKALAVYGKLKGKTFDKVVKLDPKPKGVEKAVLHKHKPVPPACC